MVRMILELMKPEAVILFLRMDMNRIMVLGRESNRSVEILSKSIFDEYNGEFSQNSVFCNRLFFLGQALV